ncbi:hypothetical protein [Cohnella laeviribosi]
MKYTGAAVGGLVVGEKFRKG